jgi:hypothetical protein
MTVLAQQISIPSNQSPVNVFASEPENSSSISIRNTGTVTILLGSSATAIVFPLNAGEVLGVQAGPDDVLQAQVQTAGTAGQLTILGMN